MGFSPLTRRVWIGSLLAAALTAMLVLALPSPVRADAFDKALAEIDEALETNPNGVSPGSLRTCRSMRKTAVLLRKMGHYERAVRRLKACRRLLGLEDQRSRAPKEPGLPCFA